VTTLGDIAVLIRSKNAGPFALTFDIMFSEPLLYDIVVASGVITAERMSALYDVPVEKVAVFECPECLALKISVPRYVSAGDPTDGDVYGAQQHGPLIDLEIPLKPTLAAVR
jgi:hypothetical protein